MLQTKTIDTSRIWVVIPTFNNKDTIFDVACKCHQRLEHVLVVDDGSIDVNVETLFSGTDIIVLRHTRNLGKGMAIRTALQYIRKENAEFMLTIDADGQHQPEDIERFIPLLKQNSSAIIIGSRNFNSLCIPGKSRFGRDFSNFWLRLETGKIIDDSQSGFRAYPVEYLSRMKLDGRCYDFEIEVLIRAVWSGLELSQIPINVFYPPQAQRMSSFRPFIDNMRIALMHARLIGRRLLPIPYPKLVRRTHTEYALNLFAHPVRLIKVLLKENATPLGLAVSAGVGMFLGVLPLVSVHILVIIYVTSRLHLNKIMAVAVQNLCMPPFVPVACIELGYFMLHKRWFTDITWKTVFGEIPKRLWEWLLGSLILAPVLAVIVGVAVFFLAQALHKRADAYAVE
ncbi:DUF2062 domain-containing protein [bacterium]|nr:MAG: DUF2062 domain-containing protein [bacterium]